MTEALQLTPTRSAFLELQDERQLIREGFEFLDEKRMIIAQEMLRQVRRYRQALDDYRLIHGQAVAALAGAAARHGLEGLTVYPSLDLEEWRIDWQSSRFMGVVLLQAGESGGDSARRAQPALPSPEAEHCSGLYLELLALAGSLAAIRANLQRLISEYTRTERRARAMENVLLPEIDEQVRQMEEKLEAIDREESLRVRFARPRGLV